MRRAISCGSIRWMVISGVSWLAMKKILSSVPDIAPKPLPNSFFGCISTNSWRFSSGITRPLTFLGITRSVDCASLIAPSRALSPRPTIVR